MTLRTLSLAASLLLGPLSTQGAEVGGIELPQRRGELKLQGAGLLRKGFFFKVYVGALYLEQTDHADRVLSQVPKRIDIHYFHHTPKKHMIRVADATLKKNIPAEQLARLQPNVTRLHEAYLNGQKGSCASLLYRPGDGLTYLYDDQPILNIPCDEFANAYFSIWLGDEPSSHSVKKSMLGDSKP